jgi:hypothetical protein
MCRSNHATVRPRLWPMLDGRDTLETPAVAEYQRILAAERRTGLLERRNRVKRLHGDRAEILSLSGQISWWRPMATPWRVREASAEVEYTVGEPLDWARYVTALNVERSSKASRRPGLASCATGIEPCA